MLFLFSYYYFNYFYHLFFLQSEKDVSAQILPSFMYPHCNKLQHAVTNCNTLQHTVTHCNTLQECYFHLRTHRRTPPASHWSSNGRARTRQLAGTRVCMYVDAVVCVHVRARATCVRTCVCAYVYLCVRVCVFVSELVSGTTPHPHMHVPAHAHTNTQTYTHTHTHTHTYGVATISRIDKIIGIFWEKILF